MYHEATFIEKHKDRAKATLHSTAIQAATIAKKAKVNKLLLGHFSSRYDGTDTHLQEAKTVFENSFAVEDGDRYFI
jgi:ribonuclease Z